MLNLINNRREIEKVVYSKGINVALTNAEESVTYQKFQRNLYRALNRQIQKVAKSDRLDMLIFLSKNKQTDLAKDKGINPDVIVEIAKLIADESLENTINIAAYLYWAGEQGGKAAMDKVGIQGIFGLSNPELLAYFDDYSNLLIQSVDSYTKKWIAQKIQEGKDSGLTPYQIQESLIKDGRNISRIRAERIVLTETAKAMTTVELKAMMRYGIKEKIWRTSRDDRVDPICVGLEGEKVAINKLFSGGYQGPPAHVSCRCYVEEVMPYNWQYPDKPWLGE